jgi:hypothetical protein
MRSIKFSAVFAMIVLLMFARPALSASLTPANYSDTSQAATEAKTAALVQRLETIKAMDKSAMSRTEKKSLRKETREIRKEMKGLSGGVYLSVGALIIVILLLILLL